MSLSDEQKQVQQRAAYGLPQSQSIDVSGMSHEQIEALRSVLFQHDAQHAAMTREFDLNKPPVPPYRYQEFPRLVYRDTKTALANNADELEELLARDWSITSPAVMEVNLGDELSPAIMAEVNALDREARKPSRDELERQLEKLKAENEALKQKRK